MDDLVRREDVVLALLKKGRRSKRYKLGEIWELNFTEIREALADVPSAQPEIIRCKECKHLCQDNGCPLRTWWTHTEDDFCSYAERKEE